MFYRASAMDMGIMVWSHIIPGSQGERSGCQGKGGSGLSRSHTGPYHKLRTSKVSKRQARLLRLKGPGAGPRSETRAGLWRGEGGHAARVPPIQGRQALGERDGLPERGGACCQEVLEHKSHPLHLVPQKVKAAAAASRGLAGRLVACGEQGVRLAK